MYQNQSPLVSICCLTYNHEHYIRDAINGFLLQKTTFPFEILIHDDASTDNTAEIIREYEAKYPDIIKPIYQTENQYSKGIGISKGFQFPRVKGKYIALCEGDDYWTDANKLQKQVDLMQRYPQCNISFHPALEKYADGSHEDQIICKYSLNEQIYSPEEVIIRGGGFMPTASLMFKYETVIKMLEFYDYVNFLPIGDFFVKVIGSSPSGAIYYPEIQCVYRRNSISSISSVLGKTKGRLIFCRQMIEAYGKLDNYLDRKYSSAIRKRKSNFLKWNFKLFILRLNIFYAFRLIFLYVIDKINNK